MNGSLIAGLGPQHRYGKRARQAPMPHWPSMPARAAAALWPQRAGRVASVRAQDAAHVTIVFPDDSPDDVAGPRLTPPLAFVLEPGCGRADQASRRPPMTTALTSCGARSAGGGEWQAMNMRMTPCP